MLPYFLGCPGWNDPAWLGDFYPQDCAGSDFLSRYCQTFNCVEGNTTFYASPAPATVQRWTQLMPEHFRFCAKLPRAVSHEGDLRDNLGAARTFLDLLAPLGARLTPLWLQLPASFGPQRLHELEAFLDALNAPALAVEVRNLQFFDRSEAERALNRLLHGRGVERICLDSRALFSCPPRDAAVLHAQSKKPRVAVRPAAFSQSPQVRFIGHPDLDANDPFLQPWLDKLADWIEAGLAPHIYLHTPDNQQAPQLAQRFHQLLQQRLPGLADLHWPEAPEQIKLF